jgi:hypothetical protein
MAVSRASSCRANSWTNAHCEVLVDNSLEDQQFMAQHPRPMRIQLMADHKHLPLGRGCRVPSLRFCCDQARAIRQHSPLHGGAVWRRLVDWPSGNVAWHPVLRADYRCAGLGCRVAAGRDPVVRVGWRHGRTASICADAWSPERIAGKSKRFRFCFQLREVSGDFARQRFQDHGLCRFTDSLQGAKPFIGGQAFQCADFECGDCLGGATECSDAIRRRL